MSTKDTMRRRLVLVWIWLSVTAILGGFFLPWVVVELREPTLVQQMQRTGSAHELVGRLNDQLGRVVLQVRRGTETITGDLSSLAELPHKISGAQIPQLANDERAKLLMVVAEMVTHRSQDLDRKSYAVYLVPGIALLFGLLLTAWRMAPVTGGIALASLALAVVGCWKLLTIKSDAIAASIGIGPGLWISLAAYLSLAFAAGCLFWFDRSSRVPKHPR